MVEHNHVKIWSLCHVCRIRDAGLVHIMCHYGTTRAEVYKRLWQVLYFGNKVGATGDNDHKPTYVYPDDLRAAVRRRFPPDTGAPCRDSEFGPPSAYLVSWEEIVAAKWPQPPKSCKLCSSGRGKPY